MERKRGVKIAFPITSKTELLCMCSNKFAASSFCLLVAWFVWRLANTGATKEKQNISIEMSVRKTEDTKKHAVERRQKKCREKERGGENLKRKL